MAMARYTINPRIKMNKKERVENLSHVLNENSGVISEQPRFTVSNEAYEQALADMNEGMSQFNLKNHYTLTAFSAIYSKVVKKQSTMIKEVDKIKNYYLVDVVKSQLAEDSIAPRMGDEEIVIFESTNKAVKKELDDLKRRVGLDQIIENITPDLIVYGEYTLSTKIDTIKEKDDELNAPKEGKTKKIKTKSKGIVDVCDLVDQGTVVALTQDGVTSGYLVENELTGQTEVKEVADYIKFTLGGERIRVDTKNLLPVGTNLNPELKKLSQTIPRFVRVGKSMIYNFIGKFKELELLENLIPANRLNQITKGNIVGVGLPDGTDLEQADLVSKKYENTLNRKVSIDPTTQEITTANILSVAGRTRVIPLLGDKGDLKIMEDKSTDASDLMGESKEIRELILNSIGIPSELMYPSEGGDTKAEIIKRDAKYVRKLKRIQRAIVDGCKQLAFIHLANKNIPFKEEDINVIFSNTLPNIDNLDNLEQMEATINYLNTTKDFFNDLAEEDSPYADSVNLNAVVKFIDTNLKTIGLADAINTKKEGGKEPNKDALAVPSQDEEPPQESLIH